MSTICSALRCGSEEWDTIVGTSTNCSTACGALSTAREGHDDEETLGTSITCSATGKSKRRKNSNTVSAICGARRSRICTNGQTFPMSCQPATSDRGAGRPRWGRGASRNVTCCSSRASPGPCRPLALCAVVLKLGKGHCDRHPLVAQVRAEASLSPAAGTHCAAACSDAWSHHKRLPARTNTKTVITHTEVSNLGQDGTWWWWCGRGVARESVHSRTRVHLIKKDQRLCTSPFGWTDQPAPPKAVPSKGRFQASRGASRRGASYLSRCPSSPALSFLCPQEEWCLYSDRDIATLCRSCFSHERRRLSLRRRAAPSPSSRAPIMAPAEQTTETGSHTGVATP